MKQRREPSGDGASGRDRLLEAAAAEFGECGYAGCSMAAVARRAGISKSTIFHHFDSKESLYLAVITNAVAAFGQTLEHLLADHADPAKVLPEFQRSHLEHLHHHEQVTRLILRQLQYDATSDQDLRQVVETMSDNFIKLRDYLERTRQEGLIRAGANIEVAALLMYAANVFFFQNREALSKLPGLRAVPRADQFAEAVADIVLRGLAARSDEP